jgi:hypothetical protein
MGSNFTHLPGSVGRRKPHPALPRSRLEYHLLDCDLHPDSGITQVFKAGFRSVRCFVGEKVLNAFEAITRRSQDLTMWLVDIDLNLLVVIGYANESTLTPADGRT